MLKAFVVLAILYISGAEALYSLNASQAETCKTASYKAASTIDAQITCRGPDNSQCIFTPSAADRTTGTGGAVHISADGMTNVAFPNVEWDASVPLDKWSLAASTAKNAAWPLGFRRNVISPDNGGVMCLSIPVDKQNHKVEVMVETRTKTAICIGDTRQTSTNGSANELTSQCEASGQLIACFSALMNGMEYNRATVDSDSSVATPDAPKPATDASTQFALVIGCQGVGCTENDYEVFYRVRASAVTWDYDFATEGATNRNGGAEESLDMWCMMMEQRDRKLYNTGQGQTGATWNTAAKAHRASLPLAATSIVLRDGSTIQISPVLAQGTTELDENFFPQYFPSDLWAPIWTTKDETDRLNALTGCDLGVNCPDPALPDSQRRNIYGTGSAAAVLPSVAALLMPLLALFF